MKNAGMEMKSQNLFAVSSNAEGVTKAAWNSNVADDVCVMMSMTVCEWRQPGAADSQQVTWTIMAATRSSCMRCSKRSQVHSQSWHHAPRSYLKGLHTSLLYHASKLTLLSRQRVVVVIVVVIVVIVVVVVVVANIIVAVVIIVRLIIMMIIIRSVKCHTVLSIGAVDYPCLLPVSYCYFLPGLPFTEPHCCLACMKLYHMMSWGKCARNLHKVLG